MCEIIIENDKSPGRFERGKKIMRPCSNRAKLVGWGTQSYTYVVWYQIVGHDFSILKVNTHPLGGLQQGVPEV